MIPSDSHNVVDNPANFDAGYFDFDAGIIIESELALLSRDSIGSLSDPISESSIFLDFPFNEDSSASSHPETPNADEVTDEEDDTVRKAARQTEGTALAFPKILKNDIRRAFSRMVFNTINCGDFDIMQEFTHTFMRQNCPFVCRVVGGPQYGLPEYLYTYGPRSHVHYKLGIFVMFPDLVGTMGDSQIITSTAWPGTKIVIPFEFRMTQTYQIPTECWIPPEHQLDRLYEEPSLERMMEVLSIKDTDSNSAGSASSSAKFSFAESVLSKHANNKNSNTAPGAVKKRKRRSKLPVRSNTNYIPASFVNSLYAGATPVANPKLMVVNGQFNIYLDESHRVQNMSLVLVPQVNLPQTM